MPLDAICLSGVISELTPRMEGARIDKIQQPERDMLILSMRSRSDSFKLLVSAGSGSARIHITQSRFENPQSPPMFCMLLRKHLTGAKVISITQPSMERVAVIELDTLDELGVQSTKRLILEMIGRSTNIILTAGDGHIIDCIRRVEGDITKENSRQILPGLIYHMPPKQEKQLFFEVSSSVRRQLWSEASGEKNADKWLLETFSGLSPLICRELCHRAFGETSPVISAIPDFLKETFPAALDAFAETVINREFTPFMIIENGRPRDFSFMAVAQYGPAVETAVYDNFSTLLDEFYTRRDKVERMRHRSQTLTKSVKNARDRAARKMAAQYQELETTAGRDALRRSGDLITANMYKIKKGMTSFTAEDFYAEGCPEICVYLDPLKTPQQNAAAYFKNYNKAKTAEKYLNEQIAMGASRIEYLESVLDEIGRAEGERDLGDIRRELIEAGFIKKPSGGKKERLRSLGPMSFKSSSGLEILVGRNNSQNDELTTKLARKNDLWLHTQKIHGSHVIIRTYGAEPDEQSISEAAAIAAYFSQGRDSGKIPVDYALVRFVKKPHGALPGKVIYTDYRTLLASGDEKLVEKLRAK